MSALLWAVQWAAPRAVGGTLALPRSARTKDGETGPCCAAIGHGICLEGRTELVPANRDRLAKVARPEWPLIEVLGGATVAPLGRRRELA